MARIVLKFGFADRIVRKFQFSGNVFESRLAKPMRIRIIEAISRLPQGDVKKLQGQEGFRLRVGDYRVIFNKNGDILYIEKIDNRGQVYK